MNARSEEQALTVQEGEILDSKNAGIVVRDGSLDYENFVGLWRLSKLLVMSGMVPKVKEGMTMEERTSQIAVSIARGRCVGLDAFQSVESIVPINGRPMIWGNAPLAICRQSPLWVEEGFDEYWEVKGTRQDSHPAKFDDDSITAVCESLRKGAKKPMVRKFSIADAKRAGLWGASGKLYGTYPQRLLPARARAYNLNDNFGDSLKGIQIRETFDEEVDGKREVESNGDQLRKELETRKLERNADLKEQVDNRKAVATAKKPGFSYNSEALKEHSKDKVDSIKNATVLQNAAKQSFPHEFNPDQFSELDIARDLLKGIYNRIPVRMNAIECLKSASMEDGTWIGFEHIDGCSDIDYLNRIAANLEDMLSVPEVVKKA